MPTPRSPCWSARPRRSASILGAFRYASNVAFLHGDASLMPRRKAAWAAWNYLAEGRGANSLAVSYWMNALQPLGSAPDLFVTLNPPAPPRADLTYRRGNLSPSAIRRRRDERAEAVVVAAGRGSHLVLRRLFRRGFPRGRLAGGSRRGRATGRRQAAVARRGRKRPDLPRLRAVGAAARRLA